MKVTILRSTQADGGKSFDRGDTPDLPMVDAQLLIADGAAVPFSENKEAATKPDVTAPESAAKKPATGGRVPAAKPVPAAKD